jgi:hypothetical protein
MNIYQRLNQVRKAVAYIQKDKQVTGQGYMAVTHDAVTSVVREHLIEHGIIIVPSLVQSQVKETGTLTGKGVPIIRLEAVYDITFVNSELPEDRVTVRMESHALDQGDKAPGKAISYATKYAMLKLFSIETGEQEEERITAKPKADPLPFGSITPTTGAFDGMPPEREEVVRKIAGEAIEMLDSGALEDCYQLLYVENLDAQKIDNDEFLALWSLLKSHSKARGALKRMRQTRSLVGAA